MIRRRTLRPDEDEASFHFLSDSGDIKYKPVTLDADPRTSNVSVDDSRLPRSATVSTSFARSPSLPASASLDKAISSQQSSSHVEELSNDTRLGLPVNWLVFPVSKLPADQTSLPNNDDTIDFTRFDYTRPLEFAVQAESSTSVDTLPVYRSRTNSFGQIEDTLPPYHPGDDLADVVQAIYDQNSELLKKPKLKRSRPLPREFNFEEQREIRRKTRHRIRVVTRNSLGLTITLGLSCVAPQMLIAAAINGFCLGVGAHKLHQHLHFLHWNNLHVQKRDVVVAVIEGVAVKLVFLAITLNNDDFLVLTHELVSAHSEIITASMHQLPGFSQLHHVFMTPIEKIQEMLGLPSMAQRAIDFGGGGWLDPANTVLKNMFLVGAVQMAMEFAIDRVQDHFARVSGHVRDAVALRRMENEGVRLQWSRNRELMFKSADRYERGYFKR